MKAQRAIFELYFDYIQHYGSSVRIRSLLRLTTELGLSQNAARAALCRLAKQGWLEIITRNAQSYYTLTAVGRERIQEARPRVFSPHDRPWDGYWTILTYSVPERLRNSRDRLRRELMWLGFGALNTATWINPNPVVEMTLRHLALRGLADYVHLFRSRQMSSQPHSLLVERCYALKAVEKRYRRFIKDWNLEWNHYRNKNKDRIGAPLNGLAFRTKMRLLYDYGEFLYIDPFLPPELLPKDWPGGEAFGVFRDFYLLLHEPAITFFESNFEGPPDTIQEQRNGRQRTLDSTLAFFGGQESVHLKTKFAGSFAG